MLIIANYCENKAVWNALKLHISFLEDNGETIVFIVDEEYSYIIKKDYPDKKIETYTNKIELIKKLIKNNENELYAVDAYSVLFSFLAKIIKKKEIYFWVQGVAPEESYLKHKSKIKYNILSFIEYVSLLLSDKKIFVSNDMKRYLEDKYKKKYFKNIVVPCISEFKYDGSKKEKDSFVYIGGMSAWQRVDQMLIMFNQICTFKPNATFYIATLETEIAYRLLDRYIDKKFRKKVTILSIEDRSNITEFLSTKEYGLLIRDDIVVNNVSSPIKLAEYLSCGVNVIISSALEFYATQIENAGAGIKISHPEDVKKMKTFTANSRNALDIYSQYFSKEKHSENYATLLEK